MNSETIAQVRDRIAGVGNEHFNMDSWASRIQISGRGPIECGTTACLAGHTIAVVEGKFCLDSFSNSRGIRDTAMKYLGVSSDGMFFFNAWPEKYQKILKEEGGAKGALALLDDVLAGDLDPNSLPDLYTSINTDD